MRKGGSQGNTGFVVAEPFSTPRLSVGRLCGSAKERASEHEFNCPQAGCVKVFKTTAEMDKHLDVGRHCFRLGKETAYNTIKRKWATACTKVQESI